MFLLVLMGCSGGPAPCTDAVADACTPLYNPTFDEAYVRTFEPTCGTGGASCHGPDGAQGGLVLADPNEAYDHLSDYVVAEDASCSELIVRLAEHGESWSMPLGGELSDAEVCAIATWIDDGALR